MPTYEYQCRSCKHRFETWQKMMDEPLTICPECGGSIHRLLFPTGIVFKGHGFYKTDHAANGAAGENGHTPKGEGTGSSKEGEKKASAESTSDTSSASNSKTSESKAPAEAK